MCGTDFTVWGLSYQKDAMFGDERANAKEPVFGAASGTGLSGFRDNETGDARAYICAVTPPPTFDNLITTGSQAKYQILAQSANRFLKYGDGVCTCARAEVPTTQLMTCIKRTATGFLTTHLISQQCAKQFPRYGKWVRACALRNDYVHNSPSLGSLPWEKFCIRP